MGWKLVNMKLEEWLDMYEGERFHALISDPPYNLDTIQKRFGKKNSAPAKGGVYARSSRGFMGKEWDTDIAFSPELWSLIYERVLLPGAIGMAFSSTRTYHRMVSAIEDAGFIIHPMIGWIQAQGFPKATRIDVQIDKRKGIDSPLVENPRWAERYPNGPGGSAGPYDQLDFLHEKSKTRLPISDDAKTWADYRYGLQALKPSFEPICIFQKPHEGNQIDGILQYGTGAFNIEGSRIGSEKIPSNVLEEWSGFGQKERPDYKQEIHEGRWPANVVISGDTDLWYDKFFYCVKPSRKEKDAGLEELESVDYGQSGGAQSKLAQGEEEYLQESIGLNRIKKVKNPHPTVKPIELIKWLSGLILPPEQYSPRRIFVPFSGSGSEMIGALLSGWDLALGVEIEKESCEIAAKRIRYWTKERPKNGEIS